MAGRPSPPPPMLATPVGNPDIETSQLICRANQLSPFYMMATLTFNELIMKKQLIQSE